MNVIDQNLNYVNSGCDRPKLEQRQQDENHLVKEQDQVANLSRKLGRPQMGYDH